MANNRYVFCGALLLILGATALQAQSASVPPSQAAPSPVMGSVADDSGTGEAKARALLQQMVQALGGDAWLNISNFMVEGRMAGFFKNETTGSEPFVMYHKAVGNTPGIDRYELTKKRDVIELWVDDTGYEITFKGKKDLPKSVVAEHVRRSYYSIEQIAHVWMKDPNAIVTYDGTDMVGRRLCDKMTIINHKNEGVTIWTDITTHLPLRRRFQSRNATYKDFDEDVEEYEDYHVMNGIPTALSVTHYQNGDMVGQRFITTAKYNLPLQDSLFDPNVPYNKKHK